MSHLDNILRKMAQQNAAESADAHGDVSDIDYVYVEKLASAVGYLVENQASVKEAMGDMPAPEEKEEKDTKSKGSGDEGKGDKKSKLMALFAKAKKRSKGDEKKSGGPKSEPEVAEAREEEAGEESEKAAAFTQVLGKLRGSLMDKVAADEASISDTFVNDLVARLQGSSADETKVAQKEPEALDGDTVETPAAGDGETKEASGSGLTLASMLSAARSGSAGNTEESAPQSVKTAASQDVSLSALLRGSLLRKIGQAEVN